MDSARFSSRTDWDVSLNPLARRHAEMMSAGEPIIDMTESNPTRCGFIYPGAEILAALAAPSSLEYAPDPRGSRTAREAVAASYAGRGRSGIDPDRILLCASTSEAYSWLMKLLCDPGDEILIPAPGYPLFDFLAKVEEVRLERYPLEYDGRWSLEMDLLARHCGPRTRAVVVVQPNNPTGSYLSAGELTELGRFCASRGLAIISDEVFADYPFEHVSESQPSALDLRSPLAFTLGGLSKAVGLPQMKLSWIVVSGGAEEGPFGAGSAGNASPTPRVSKAASSADEALARLEVLGDTFLSVNTPIQRALPRILEIGTSVQEEILHRVRANRARLLSASRGESAWEALASEGGWYAVLRVPRLLTDEDLALVLLDRDRVFVHPGTFFDFASDGHLVVSLLPREELFREGISRIIARLDHLAE
jgi:alanine-synthesizing transaminase